VVFEDKRFKLENGNHAPAPRAGTSNPFTAKPPVIPKYVPRPHAPADMSSEPWTYEEDCTIIAYQHLFNDKSFIVTELALNCHTVLFGRLRSAKQAKDRYVWLKANNRINLEDTEVALKITNVKKMQAFTAVEPDDEKSIAGTVVRDEVLTTAGGPTAVAVTTTTTTAGGTLPPQDVAMEVDETSSPKSTSAVGLESLATGLQRGKMSLTVSLDEAKRVAGAILAASHGTKPKNDPLFHFGSS
jgi:hypothetical protein